MAWPRGLHHWYRGGVGIVITSVCMCLCPSVSKVTRRFTDSKRVVPLKEVPFGGLNDVPLNFGGKIPQKLKFWGHEKDF